MKGKILRLNENLVVVPCEERSSGWMCVIVKSAITAYPVGGYNIFVIQEDLLAGTIVELL